MSQQNRKTSIFSSLLPYYSSFSYSSASPNLLLLSRYHTSDELKWRLFRAVVLCRIPVARPDQTAGTERLSLELSAPRYSLFIHHKYIRECLCQNIIFQIAMIRMGKLGNIGFSPLVHISKWPLIVFHYHVITGYFLLNPWPFQHKT